MPPNSSSPLNPDASAPFDSPEATGSANPLNSLIARQISRRSMLKGAAAGALGIASVTSMSSLLAACGTSTSSSTATSGTVTIWDRSGDLFQVFDATISTFNKKYPNIKVKHVAVDVDAKLPTTLTTGANVPDGAFYEDVNLPILAEQFYDITSNMQPYVNDIVPFKLRVNTHNGKIVGIPWDLDPGLLYSRPDLLAQANVSLDAIKTYDDLISASQEIQGKLGTQVKPIHIEDDPGLLQLWIEMFANQQNTSLVDAQGNVRINSQPYLTILTWIKKVIDLGLAERQKYTTPGDIAQMDGNKVVFFPWAIWFSYAPQFLLKASKGKWQASALPAWTAGGSRGASMGGSSFIIPKKAKNPHLAWLWYEHLVFSPDGYKAVYGPNKLYPTGLNTSIPSFKPALANQLFQNVDALGGQNLWGVAVSTVNDIPTDYYYPTWYNQATPIFSANVQRMMDGQMTPAQVLEKSEADIKAKLIR